VLASFLCGIAQSMPELVGFRVLQGVVAGPLYPMTQTLLIAVYPPAKRGMALALLAMVTVVAPIAGPILGGWITDSYSWPWIFFINVPIGLFAAAVVRQQMRARPVVTSRQPMDYIGLLTLIVGVGALQVVLDKGNDLDWFESSFIIIGTLISVVFLAVFIIWELTDRTRWSTCGCSCTATSASAPSCWWGAMRVLRHQPDPAAVAADADGLYRDLGGPGGGADRLAAGAHVAVRGQVRAPLRPAPAGRHGLPGHRHQLLHARRLHQRGGLQHIALVQLFMGIGVALFFMPTLSILLSDLPPHQIADGSGLATFLRTLGGSFAASLTTWIWIRRADQHHAYLSEHLSTFDPATRHPRAVGRGQPAELCAAGADAQRPGLHDVDGGLLHLADLGVRRLDPAGVAGQATLHRQGRAGVGGALSRQGRGRGITAPVPRPWPLRHPART
jgi:DHA2 family multidrug resistance protein